MKGYTSKYQKAINQVNSQYPEANLKEKQRIVKQVFAKFVVGLATIGKVGGKLITYKQHPHQGINFKSSTTL